MFAARRVATKALPFTASRGFTSTSRAWVNIGDGLPDVDLVENSPGNKVNLLKELKGRGVVIGVPAAFSIADFMFNLECTINCLPGPACSATHIPSYVNHAKLKDAGQVFVVSVNDPFVYDMPHRCFPRP